MSEVQRICPQCANSGPIYARYCPSCGYDFQSALPAVQSNLPVVLSKAAVPMLVGAASVALRMGWKMLQSRWAKAAAEKAVDAAIQKIQTPIVQPQADVTERRSRRTITIRSAWSVADRNGVQQQGYSEHRIDLDD